MAICTCSGVAWPATAWRAAAPGLRSAGCPGIGGAPASVPPTSAGRTNATKLNLFKRAHRAIAEFSRIIRLISKRVEILAGRKEDHTTPISMRFHLDPHRLARSVEKRDRRKLFVANDLRAISTVRNT